MSFFMQSLQDMQVKLIFVFCLSKCSTLLPRGWHLLPRCSNLLPRCSHLLSRCPHTFCQGVHTFCQGVHTPFVKVSTHLLPRCSYLLSRCSHEGAHTFCQGVQPFDKVSTPTWMVGVVAVCLSRMAGLLHSSTSVINCTNQSYNSAISSK